MTNDDKHRILLRVLDNVITLHNVVAEKIIVLHDKVFKLINNSDIACYSIQHIIIHYYKKTFVYETRRTT